MPPARGASFGLPACIALILFGLIGAALRAEEKLDYHIRTWKTDDGLSHNSVGRMLQDSQGFLWFGTVAGLTRFDGHEFKEFRLPAAFAARGLNIRGLAVEPSGAVVVLPANGQILRLKNGKFSPHPASALVPLNGADPSELYAEPGGALWIASYSGGLARWSPDGTSRVFNEGESVAERSKRFCFASDAEGNVWISADNFLACYRAGELHPVAEVPAGPLLLAPSVGGDLWVVSGEALWTLSHGQLKKVDVTVPWRDSFGAVHTVFEDSRRSLWITRSRGDLIRFRPAEAELTEVPITACTQALEDREGNIWITTDGHGVNRLTEKLHELYDQSAGLVENTASAVCEDTRGNILLANRTGEYLVLRDGRVLNTEPRPTLPVFTNTVAADHEGAIWYGGGRSGLHIKKPGSSVAEKLPVPLNALHLLYCARNGDMWFASDTDGLGYYRQGVPTIVLPAKSVPSSDFRSMAESRDGRLWFATRTGDTYVWNGTSAELAVKSTDLPSQAVSDMLIDADDNLWFATTEGVVLKRRGSFRLFTEAEGLADRLVSQLLDDSQGRLWLGGRRGYSAVPISELLAVADGRAAKASSRRYGREQGLPSITPTSNYSPKKWRARDGRLWFATSHGALLIDPRRWLREQTAPPVFIDEIHVNGSTFDRDRPLKLASGLHRLEFKLTAPSFSSPENIEIGYQLAGSDTDWIEAGQDRVASYTNLPPGHYTLRTAARQRGEPWGAAATLEFEIIPRWWETRSATVAGIFALTAVTGFLVRRVSQQVLRKRVEKLERENALAAERTRIARDLHDELGGGLTELGLLADRIADEPERPDPSLVRGLAWRTRCLAADLSGIVWTMSGANGQLDRLALFIGQYAHRLFRATRITCRVLGTESIPAIPVTPDVQHQLLAATKEALNNIIKHSGATAASIELSMKDSVFTITLRDDGRGFDVNAATASADGNGLRNMHFRLRQLKGSCTLDSAASRGTIVVFSVPLPSVAVPVTSESPSQRGCARKVERNPPRSV